MPPTRISSVHPLRAIEGGRIDADGAFQIEPEILPEVRIGDLPARVVFLKRRSPHRSRNEESAAYCGGDWN